MNNEEQMFELLEIGNCEVLRKYYSFHELFDDLQWKVTGFWIGVVSENQAYTIPQIFKKYRKEHEEFLKALK